MTDLSDDILRALLSLARDEGVSSLRDITLGQLADAIDTSGLSTLTREAIPDEPDKEARLASPPPVNTRTRAGRAALEEAILKTLGEFGHPVTGKQVKARTGGTQNQIWRAMNRLIEAEKVTYEGRSGGTKYSLVE